MSEDRLEKAIIDVLETQAAMQNQMVLSQNQMALFQNQMSAFQSQMEKLDESKLDCDKRWSEIMQAMTEIKEILYYHTTLLLNLSEALKKRLDLRLNKEWVVG